MRNYNLTHGFRRWIPLLTIGGVLLGSAFILARYWHNHDANKKDALIKPRVQAAWFEAQQQPLFVIVRGHTEANSMVTLKARISGAVTKIHDKKSQLVPKDTPLVDLSIDDRRTHLQAAEARLKDQEVQYEAKQKLAQQNFQSKISLYDSFAALQAARNEVERARLNLGFTTIRAPFAGVVNDILVDEGEVIAEGTPVAELLNLDPTDIIASVSETDHAKIKIGTPATVRVFDGRQFTGNVTYLAKHADPKTRTFKIKVSIPNSDIAIASGLTAEAQVMVGEDRLHTLPASVLVLNDDGAIGLKLVDQAGIAHFTPVTIVTGDTHSVKVQGLPDHACVITVGQEFVADGQAVDATIAESSEPVEATP